MKLKFFAREDLLVTVPGSRPMRGQAPEYVGRKFIPGDGTVGAQFPASEKPYECEADSDEGRRLVLLTRRDSALWPADKETADACGVEFSAVSVKDGVALPTQAVATKKSSSAASAPKGDA